MPTPRSVDQRAQDLAEAPVSALSSPELTVRRAAAIRNSPAMHAGQFDQAALTGGQVAAGDGRARSSMPHSASASVGAARPWTGARRAAPRRWRSGLRPGQPGLAPERDVLAARSASRTAPSAGTCGPGRVWPARAAATRGDVVAEQVHACPSAGAQQPGAGVERRRLARAVRADQSGDPARAGPRSVTVVDRGVPAVSGRQVVDLEAASLMPRPPSTRARRRLARHVPASPAAGPEPPVRLHG